jgi:hypothetical protein
MVTKHKYPEPQDLLIHLVDQQPPEYNPTLAEQQPMLTLDKEQEHCILPHSVCT